MDRSERTVQHAGWGYQQLSFLVEADRYRHRHRRFCNIRVLIVAWFLDYLRPSFPPTRLSHSLPFRPFHPHTLKQNEGDARRILKDNDYEA